MNSEEKRAKGIYFGGLGLLLFGIGFIVYAVGQITLGSIQTAQMGASTWMKVDANASATDIFQDEPSISKIMDTLVEIQKELEEK